MDINKIISFNEFFWQKSILPALIKYLKIPNSSPAFDPLWEQNGYIEDAVNVVVKWCKKNAAIGMKTEILRAKGRTPCILIDIPGKLAKQVLYYGHLDKQPAATGWLPGLGAYKPVLQNNKLYGRGAADDGYAVFTAIASVIALQQQRLPHPNIQILIECSEESGSIDLPYYIDKYISKIINPDLVICLDSGCGNYEQLWLTTSLRGMITGVLEVAVLTEGMHSGMAAGIVPSAMQIMQQQLANVTIPGSTTLAIPALNAVIPKIRQQQIITTANILKDSVYSDFSFVKDVQPLHSSHAELLSKQTWQNAYEIIGIDGLPGIEEAGNVHPAAIAAKISIRTPPTCNTTKALPELIKSLTTKPPFNSKVSFTPLENSDGWHANYATDKLTAIINESSNKFFQQDCAYMGEGGSIPLINFLQNKFPETDFLITGILGPHANAHGPNEFLHLGAVKKLSSCLSYILTNYN